MKKDRPTGHVERCRWWLYTAPGDDRAESTLKRVMASIEENLVGVPLEPGMRCFIDNYRAVHGRARPLAGHGPRALTGGPRGSARAQGTG